MAKAKKEPLNTTIDTNVLNDFREYCKDIGVNMNLVLETFMAQFSDGQFTFKLGKNKAEVELEE